MRSFVANARPLHQRVGKDGSVFIRLPGRLHHFQGNEIAKVDPLVEVDTRPRERST